MSKQFKPILCLDFDGVIHSYTSGWQGASTIADKPVPGALAFIIDALKTWDVAIHSSRSGQWGGRRAMKRWLREELTLIEDQRWSDFICENSSMEPWDVSVRDAAHEVVKRIRWPLFKPGAFITIDDRALTFDGSWPNLDSLRAFKPWNKK